VIRVEWLSLLAFSLGCASDGAVEPDLPAAAGAAGQHAAPLAGTAHGGDTAAVSGSTGSGGLSHDWSRFPFVGSGGADAAGSGGHIAAGAAGSPSSPMPSVEANCNTLCDCVIDVCGNVLRILEHSQCSPGCEGLSKAQIECRLAECLQGGSEGGAALRCEHAVGSGTGLPAACQ
jgi:hypothetical protein